MYNNKTNRIHSHETINTNIKKQIQIVAIAQYLSSIELVSILTEM